MFFKKHLLSILWALVILVLTMIPGESIPNVPIVSFDKIVHFGIFGLLMFLILRDLKRSHFVSNYIRVSFIFSLLYGYSIEVIQLYIPGRSFSVYDMIANTIGVILGYLAFKINEKKGWIS